MQFRKFLLVLSVLSPQAARAETSIFSLLLGTYFIHRGSKIPIDPAAVYRNRKKFEALHGPRGKRLVAALADNSYRVPLAGFRRKVPALALF